MVTPSSGIGTFVAPPLSAATKTSGKSSYWTSAIFAEEKVTDESFADMVVDDPWFAAEVPGCGPFWLLTPFVLVVGPALLTSLPVCPILFMFSALPIEVVSFEVVPFVI